MRSEHGTQVVPPADAAAAVDILDEKVAVLGAAVQPAEGAVTVTVLAAEVGVIDASHGDVVAARLPGAGVGVRTVVG